MTDRLRDLVLTTPVGGRGPVDGSVRDRDRDGAPPSERELLRVCVAVLSRLCELEAASPMRAAPDRAGHPGRWRRRRGSAPVVVGTSPQAQALRAGCRAVRRPGPTLVLVVGGSLDAMAAGLWRDRVEAGSGVRWRRLWEGFVARDELPAALDPAGQVARWRERTAPGRVHLLLAAPGGQLPGVEELLGVRPPTAADRLDAVDTDLLRRLNQSLATREEAVRRRPYDGALAARFDHAWTGEPGVPGPDLAWATERGERLAAAIGDCGVTVHGEPGVVVPSVDVGLRGVPVAATLERALDVLGQQLDARPEGGDRWPAR